MIDPPRLLPDAIEAAMAATPDAIAVVAGRQQLSYAALDEQTRRLAVGLRQQGAGSETVVGVMVDRSVDLLVALVATLRAGAAFLPFDPVLPHARLTAMVEDARPVLILAGDEHRALAGSLAPALDPRGSVDRIDPSAYGQARIHPLGLAYVLFTSGTTGRPKGVANTHVALANRIAWMQRAYALDHRDRILQKTPASFDVSVWEFLWPLTIGACVVMARPGGHRDLPYLKRIMRVAAITRLHFVPSMLDAFLQDGIPQAMPSLRQIVVSGEALTPALATRVGKALPAVSLDNLYGPTEAAIDVTAHHVAAGDDPVPIGREIDGIVMRVVDRRSCARPDNEQGELGITGIGLARGYLRRPDLTAASFVPDRTAGPPGARMYRTGDLGVRRDDGALLYRGRLDHQVKLNGQRIELLEVEAALADCMDGATCAVAIDATGLAQTLVAYMVAGDAIVRPIYDTWLASQAAATRAAAVTSAVGRLEAEPRTTFAVEGLVVGWDKGAIAPEELATSSPGSARAISLSGIVHRFPAIDVLERVLIAARTVLAPGGRLSLTNVIDPLVLDGELVADDLCGLARLSSREPGLLVSPGWVRAWAAGQHAMATIVRDGAAAERYHAVIDFSARDSVPGEPPAVVTWPAWAMVNARLATIIGERLIGVLPVHMHPSAYIALPSMPVTSNGKADRARLPILADLRQIGAPDDTPMVTTPLARWWTDVLGHAPVHAGDDFFLAGGDSIQAIRLSARAHAAGWALTPADIHQARTLSVMAMQLRRLDGPPMRPATATATPDILPPFIAGMMQESAMWPGLGINIEQVTFETGMIDPAHWQRAWDAMIGTHALFHASFRADRIGFHVECREGCSLPIDWCDLTDLPERAREERWRQLIEIDAVTPFALAKPPLMRMRMARWDAQSWRGAWTLHHALTDGWSYATALGEVRAAYLALARNEAPSAGTPAADFADWCQWRAEQAPTAEDARFWRRYLANAAPAGKRAFAAAIDAPRIVRSGDMIDRPDWLALLDAAHASGAGPFALLQAIWDDAVRSAWPDARMGALHAVRPSTLLGMERIVGPLFTVLPVVGPHPGPLGERALQLARDAAEKRNRLTADPVYLSSIDPDGGVFDAILVYENTPAIVTGGWLHNIRIRSRFNQPLVVLIWPDSEGLMIDLYVDHARVMPQDADKLLQRFLTGLKAAPGRLAMEAIGEQAAETVDHQLIDVSL